MNKCDAKTQVMLKRMLCLNEGHAKTQVMLKRRSC